MIAFARASTGVPLENQFVLDVGVPSMRAVPGIQAVGRTPVGNAICRTIRIHRKRRRMLLSFERIGPRSRCQSKTNNSSRTLPTFRVWGDRAACSRLRRLRHCLSAEAQTPVSKNKAGHSRHRAALSMDTSLVLLDSHWLSLRDQPRNVWLQNCGTHAANAFLLHLQHQECLTIGRSARQTAASPLRP